MPKPILPPSDDWKSAPDAEYLAWLEARALQIPESLPRRRENPFLLGFITTGIVVVIGKLAGSIDMSNSTFLACLIALGLAIAVYGFNYLEGGQTAIALFLSKLGAKSFKLGSIEFSTGDNSNINTSAELLAFREKIDFLTAEINSLKDPENLIDYDSISTSLKHKILRETTSDLVSYVEEQLNVHINSEYNRSKQALRPFHETRSRIIYAIERLSRRGAVNLIVGGSVTLSGVFLLGYFIAFEQFNDANAVQFLMHFAPRLAIVTFVQVFAFFFLRLYKLGLEEIKYFQNELTNIEQKEAAMSLALLTDDDDLKSDILLVIAKTERNNVLEKGQSTIEIERAKLESNGNLVEVIQALGPILAKNSFVLGSRFTLHYRLLV